MIDKKKVKMLEWFLVPQTTVKGHESKNKDQISTKKQ